MSDPDASVRSMKGVRSIDIVLDEVRRERDAQLRHFDAIDTKAGIVLGFAGALVALTPPHTDLLVLFGRIAAVVSGIASMLTFWPNTYWSTDLRRLREGYLAAEIEFSKLRLLDTQINLAEREVAILAAKAARLKAAMGALAIAVLLTAVGLGLH